MAQLNWLASGLAEAGSRLERTHWFTRLQSLVEGLLVKGDDDSLDAVLNRLGEADPVGHDALMDTIESVIESTTVIIEGQSFDVLMIACPILTWSRYPIPTPNLTNRDRQLLSDALRNSVLTRHARLNLLGMLVGPDQIPRGFSALYALTRTITEAMEKAIEAPLHAEAKQETNRYLSDTRYLVGIVAVPSGEAVFRWQETRSADATTQANDRPDIERLWSGTVQPILEPLLAGSRISPLLPDAFHAACAAADKTSRPYSVEACVRFLSESIDLPPEKQRAVIGPFHAQRLEEYRIGLGPLNEEALYHGVVWPLLGEEDEQADMVAEIEQVLRQAGVTDIVIHEHRFPMEYCEDCGGPMYANADGELAHLEMPESSAAQPSILH